MKKVEVGDLIQCIGKKLGEPEVGEIGIVVKCEQDNIVASVNNRGRGRIFLEDWKIISKASN